MHSTHHPVNPPSNPPCQPTLSTHYVKPLCQHPSHNFPHSPLPPLLPPPPLTPPLTPPSHALLPSSLLSPPSSPSPSPSITSPLPPTPPSLTLSPLTPHPHPPFSPSITPPLPPFHSHWRHFGFHPLLSPPHPFSPSITPPPSPPSTAIGDTLVFTAPLCFGSLAMGATPTSLTATGDLADTGYAAGWVPLVYPSYHINLLVYQP